MFKTLSRALTGLAAISLLFNFPTPAARAQSAVSSPVSPNAIAVLDFQAKGGVSNDEASIISDRVRTQIFRSGRFQVMERANMLSILKEQGFQQTQANCDSTSCSVTAGKLLAVRQIMTGSVSKLGSIYTLSFRIVDVERGEILKDEFRDCRCSLEEVLTQLTGQMVTELVQPPAPVPTAAPSNAPSHAPSNAPALPQNSAADPALAAHLASLPLGERQAFYRSNEHYPLLASTLSLPLLPFGYIYANEWGKFWTVTGIEAGIGALAVLAYLATGGNGGLVAPMTLVAELAAWGYGVVDSFLVADDKNRQLGQLLRLSQGNDSLFLGQNLSYGSAPATLSLFQYKAHF